jgi:hypothetical protein
MNLVNLSKGIAEIVVSAGAGAIVGNTIKATLPAKQLGVFNLTRPLMAIGGLVLSNMVGEAAAKYATDSIDKAAEQVKNIKNAVDEVVGDTSD